MYSFIHSFIGSLLVYFFTVLSFLFLSSPGTEEGKIHKCSKTYSSQFLETYDVSFIAYCFVVMSRLFNCSLWCLFTLVFLPNLVCCSESPVSSILGLIGARKTHKFSGTNQKPERRRPFRTGLVRHCPQGLFSPFFTFLRAIFFRPFRLSLAPTICPWVSEDGSPAKAVSLWPWFYPADVWGITLVGAIILFIGLPLRATLNQVCQKKTKWRTELPESFACPIPASMGPILRGRNGSFPLFWWTDLEVRLERTQTYCVELLVLYLRGIVIYIQYSMM